ncbi:RNA polymerase sigma-70 factor, ECF subfamily [Candidatus Kryptobacter tengchongensis]|uniref:RNA polymerase sigma-70 factor, ECF subfamily n=1 Tax=Kryptobacter tengchongensis TaxID=1643429 RepID=A0A656DB63_KRYT1|nr:sigma-70 family RNA polymerase sigma factor [Candidatus Kryptobacter tengchongensis]CUS88615.1 RNA polymerase sigma-70 factor, ECF subfamily [Candidatus Kryptobacter tengchongensis]CUT03995.1 RNA polymerase sigma-70 factor, ECF subfamily [Candidatus Kryptobacter tengchongensis]CUU06533.1 RNA polymerase sigma-70 factor, ECF subfamily [Candidatus Kryptobacter tengchongensis]
MKEIKKEYKKLTDTELVKLAVKGDELAYVELMNRYKKKVETIVNRIVRNKSETDDLVQEIFTKAFTSISSFKSEFSFSTWLYKIATNHCIDFVRKRKISTYSLDEEYELEDDSIQREIPDWSNVPDRELFQKQKNEIIYEAINSLPEHYRKVIIMRHFEDKSYEEIAKELKLPLGTVKVHIFRARELLYKKLKDKLKHY